MLVPIRHSVSPGRKSVLIVGKVPSCVLRLGAVRWVWLVALGLVLGFPSVAVRRDVASGSQCKSFFGSVAFLHSICIVLF